MCHAAAGMRFAEQCGPTRQFRPGTFCFKGDSMQWSKPAFEDLRFGFEITMYISHR
jgi:coenzyme PQQ precursor peptide PqqA